MSEQEIENEIQAKGLNAPRLSPEKIDAAIRNGATIEQALRLIEQLSTVVGSGAAQKIRMKAAADLNPHARKGGFGLVLALLGLGSLAGGLTSCATHTVRTVPETAERVECYAVEWPDDASRNPEHYWTETIDGKTITTVPKIKTE